jgi:hypothetical protein
MNTKPWDSSGQARRALQGIVADPHYGSAALSQPAVISNLLKDFLPDEPREAGLLVAAAQADLASSLRGHLAQGLDPATAVSLTASSFVSSSSHTQEAGLWVVTEFALALGMDPYRTAQAAPPPPVAPPLVAPPPPTAVDALVGQAMPPYPAVSPAPPAYAAAGNPWPPAVAAPPSPWQPAVAAPPSSSSRRPVAPAIIGLGGALLTLIACFVPLSTFAGQPSFGVFFGHTGFATSFDFWFAFLPIVMLLTAIVAGIGLLVPGDRPRGRAMFGGMLMALGVQTVVLFGFYGYGLFSGAHHGGGGPLGILGGLALLLGGIVAMAAGGNRGAVLPGAGGVVPPGVGS